MTKTTKKAATTKATPKGNLEAETKGKQAGVLRMLTPMAKEVNAKIELAAQADGKAFDYRLSAALVLANAKNECEKVKLKFETWCKENITLGYESARKLAVIGNADDPKLALQDMRSSNAKRNAQLRAQNKTEKPSENGPKPIASQNNPVLQALDTLKSQTDSVRRSMAESLLAKSGLAIVDKSQVLDIDPMTASRDAFRKLNSTEKTDFIEWAIAYSRPKASATKKAEPETDPLDIPDFLKRDKKSAEAKVPTKSRRKAKS